MTVHEIVDRLHQAAVTHAEEAIAEIPRTLRRARTVLLVVAVTVPAFAIGLLAVLWHLAH